MKTINLSQIMKTAWQFFHTTGENFADCLKMAWANFKLIQKRQKTMKILTKFFRWIILSKKVNTVHTYALAIGSLYVLVHLAIIIFKESAK